MERYDLPDGWEWKKIGEVANTTSGGTPSRTRPEFYNGAIPWLKSGELEDNYISDTEEKISESGLKNSSAKIFPKGTALVALYGATVGKTGILEIDSATNQAVCALFPRDNSFTAEYITYWLRSQRQSLIELSTGGAQPNISQGIVRDFDIPLPQLPEQQRIVAKIESLFEQSRTARTALTRVPVLMSQFRRAVLASAFRGELVEPDPNDEPAVSLLERVNEARISNASKKLAHSEVVDTDNLPEIPETWAWTTLEVLAEIRNGVTKGRDLNRFETVEIPYLRVANVQDGYLDLKEMKTIKVKNTEFEKVRLKPNDILFIEGGDRDKLGRGTVWRGEIDVCTHQNHVHCARLYLQDVVPDWVSFASQLSYARDYFFSAANQTVNLASLNSTQLKGLPVPLPPVNEQKRILKKINALFAQADIIEQAASVSLRRAEQVDQSILARAFRGELG